MHTNQLNKVINFKTLSSIDWLLNAYKKLFYFNFKNEMLESGCYLVQLPFSITDVYTSGTVSELDISSEVTLYQGTTTFCTPPLHHLLPGNLRDWVQIWLWTQESCRRRLFPVAHGTDSPQRCSHPGPWPILRVHHVAASLSMASITFLAKSSSSWYLFQYLLNPHYIQRPNHSEL